MKKLLLLAAFSFLILSSPEIAAQGKDKGSKKKIKKEQAGPPPWAPAHGYRAKTRYVYFKDYDVYYDNERGVYISITGSKWNISATLPSPLKGIDLKTAVKIDLDFSGDDPQRYHTQHKQQYKKKKS